MKGYNVDNYKGKNNRIVALLTGLIGLIIFLLSIIISVNIEGAVVPTVFGMIFSIATTVVTSTAIDKKIILNNFSKKHPEINLNVNLDRLSHALERYSVLSNLPKDIEERKEQYLGEYNEKVREMTTSEKIAFFKEQKEFWETVQMQENYINTDDFYKRRYTK